MRLVATLLFCLVASACHSSPGPARAAAAGPELPPASGTVVGILVDEASTLHLRDDQLDQLRAIDTALAARNDRIDGESRGGEHAVVRGPRRHQSGMGGSAKGRMAPPPPPGAHDLIRDPAELQRERTANNRAALAQAFAILDPAQTAAAHKLLGEHGVTVSNDASAATEGAATDEPSSARAPDPDVEP
jgi:hypothetical protein